MKTKTSVSLSDETLKLADSIAAKLERSRSWVIDRAITLGLPAMDTPEAKKLREAKLKKK